MKIILTNLSLVNFKGLRNFTAEFHPEFTRVQGDNATGKSTIADAISWLLFGKDMFDRKDFEVKTLDSNGQVIPRIDHEVTGTLLIDGVQVVLKRILKEKWVKKQGTSETVFTGNETLYFVNDVPKSQKDYQDYINQIIPEQTFKLLTNPAYFNSIKWQDRRAMLTAIANIPDDDTIAGADLADLLATMRTERKTLEDLKKEYAAKKTKLKIAIEQIPARLDELSRNTPEPQDWEALTAGIITAKSDIAGIDAQIADASKGVEEVINVRTAKLKEKAELFGRKSIIELEMRKLFAENAGDKDRKLADLKQQIENKRERVAYIGQEVDEIARNIEKLTGELDSLRSVWTAKNAETLSFEGLSNTCPTCKQPLPESDIEEQRNALIKNFNINKANALEQINSSGKGLKSLLAQSQATKTEKENLISHMQDDIKAISKQISEIEATPSHLKSVEAMLAESEEYKTTLAALEAIVLPEVPEQVDTTELKEKKAGLQSQVESLQKQLLLKDQIEAAGKRKAELLAEESTLAAQMAEMEGFEFQLSEFQSRKMQAVEDAVNKLFDGVKFRMFEQQINGGIADTCQTMINGVPYSDANRAAQINAGLEIIETFGKVHDMSAPICIDNAEAVNSLYAVDNAQMIGLYVTTGKLKVVAEGMNKKVA